MKRFLASSLLVAVALVAPAQAAPNDSAIDQYLPTVPGAGGDRVPDDKSDASEKSTTLPPAQSQEIADLGADGVAVVAITEASAPPTKKRASPKKQRTSKETRIPAGGAPLGSIVAGAVGSSERGMGAALPIVLGLALLGALLAVLLRRHGTGSAE